MTLTGRIPLARTLTVALDRASNGPTRRPSPCNAKVHDPRARLALALLLPGAAAAQDEETFSLTILHTNDTHAHHEPNAAGDGGAARQAAVVNQIRAEGGNVLLLDAGDRFTGTLFHQQYRGQDSVQIMTAIDYDGMTLGNHEFDDGDQILADFIDGVAFPVVTANVDFSGSPELAGKVPPYAILDVAGEQVGIIGLVTADTPVISSPGEGLVFDGDYAAVTQAIVDELTGPGRGQDRARDPHRPGQGQGGRGGHARRRPHRRRPQPLAAEQRLPGVRRGVPGGRQRPRRRAGEHRPGR